MKTRFKNESFKTNRKKKKTPSRINLVAEEVKNYFVIIKTDLQSMKN